MSTIPYTAPLQVALVGANCLIGKNAKGAANNVSRLYGHDQNVMARTENVKERALVSSDFSLIMVHSSMFGTAMELLGKITANSFIERVGMKFCCAALTFSAGAAAVATYHATDLTCMSFSRQV